ATGTEFVTVKVSEQDLRDDLRRTALGFKVDDYRAERLADKMLFSLDGNLTAPPVISGVLNDFFKGKGHEYFTQNVVAQIGQNNYEPTFNMDLGKFSEAIRDEVEKNNSTLPIEARHALFKQRLDGAWGHIKYHLVMGAMLPENSRDTSPKIPALMEMFNPWKLGFLMAGLTAGSEMVLSH